MRVGESMFLTVLSLQVNSAILTQTIALWKELFGVKDFLANGKARKNMGEGWLKGVPVQRNQITDLQKKL